jgi:hypothetical protein
LLETETLVTQNDRAEVMAMSNDTTDGLIYGPRGLLDVPIVAREFLKT